jgi:hypothetical protein
MTQPLSISLTQPLFISLTQLTVYLIDTTTFFSTVIAQQLPLLLSLLQLLPLLRL